MSIERIEEKKPNDSKNRESLESPVELLAPAGNLEKLTMALQYGADAIYMAGGRFGLRAYAGNFTTEQMEKAITLAHSQGKKAYITVNIFAHNKDLLGLDEYLREIEAIGADAIIVSDPGVFAIARRTVPNMPIHISTQANVTNVEAARFWSDLGAERIVLARELSLQEIREIQEEVDVELEVFIHGAMCMSYSGRCLISDYLTGRKANQGECTQACRWKYALQEEQRPGMYMPIEEDERGSYIFNARDLCLLADIPALIESGIKSFKIEGRMKSVHYVSTVTQVYRRAIDSYYKKKAEGKAYQVDRAWWDELSKISHRPYTRGFLYGPPGQEPDVAYNREYDFVGVVRHYDEANQRVQVEVRNRILLGDILEFTGPNKANFLTVANEIWDEENQPIDQAPRPHQLIWLKSRFPLAPLDMVRRPKGSGEEEFLKVRIDPSHIFHLDIILEGFGHLGVPTTVDRQSGIVLIRTTKDTRPEVIKILETLPWPAQLFEDPSKTKPS
ncbi:U32 family peptidase C-terminal domain-containing protein [Heliorestis convoluta]|uniref:Peptidase U32 n=1 Tax=Heliorestis convoluta TaxID=356322 RepID=A0A5Q2N2D6_9FIRM|nr:U32 family peptidase C-terminal domain-containing protein [Heliorestis convoluta]QGG46725.1 Peptidase U32 [Heliorestis convoluta]